MCLFCLVVVVFVGIVDGSVGLNVEFVEIVVLFGLD